MNFFDYSLPGDLHMHTTNSDGSLSVSELVNLINEKQLGVVSITDHESVNSYYCPEIKSLQCILITGVELRFNFGGMIAELLAYGFDLEKMQTFLSSGIYPTKEESETYLLNSLVSIAKEKNIKMTEDILDKYDPEKECKVVKYFLKNIDITDEHTNEIMQKECPVGTSFYRSCIMNKESSWYVNTSELYPDFYTVVNNVKNCGGLVFVPHAFAYDNASEELIRFIVASKKVDGFETEHSIFSKEQSNYLYRLIRKENLLFSKGSDFHAFDKKNRMVGMIQSSPISITHEMQNWIFKLL